MRYQNVHRGIFVERPNRFIAKALVHGHTETVHVKNTGRCRELLVSGCTVYLQESDNPARKTKYDLISVEKQRCGKSPLCINMDSQIPNDAAEEWLKKGELFSKNAVIQREVCFGNSRFDFYIEDGGRRCFMEVKGVTLEQNGVVMFPDAPTERGVKHLHELIHCVRSGYEAAVLFVIQMKEVSLFRPNDSMHPEFGKALRKAASAGVKILAMDCMTTPDSLEIDRAVPVDLTRTFFSSEIERKNI